MVGIPGFGVVAWQANLGFKNLVEGQTHRAEIELQAREHSYRLDQQKVAAERTYQHRVLAASLHGELIALLSAVHQQQTILRAQNVVWKRLSLDRDYKNADAPFTPPRFAVPIYQANIDRLGLLGPSVAADVVQVYAPAATPPPPAAKLMPGEVYTANEGFLLAFSNWTGEILHVGSRLAAIQGFREDPGTLLDYRNSRPKSGADGQ